MSNLIKIKNVLPFVRTPKRSQSLWFHLPNSRVMSAIFFLSLVTEVILFSIFLIAFKRTDIWTRIRNRDDDIDLQAEALFGKNITVNATKRNSVSIKSLLAANGVLLQPPLLGRLGNQMFSYAATWGMVQRLRTNLNHSRPVELVVKNSQELFRFLTFLLLFHGL